MTRRSIHSSWRCAGVLQAVIRLRVVFFSFLSTLLKSIKMQAIAGEKVLDILGPI